MSDHHLNWEPLRKAMSVGDPPDYRPYYPEHPHWALLDEVLAEEQAQQQPQRLAYKYMPGAITCGVVAAVAAVYLSTWLG
jgi:hypothetical protein